MSRQKNSSGITTHLKKVTPPLHSLQCIAEKLALARPLVCLVGALLARQACGTILHTWAADNPKKFAAIVVRNWEIPPEFSRCNADLVRGQTLAADSCRIAVFKLRSFAKDLNFVPIPADDTPAVRAVLKRNPSPSARESQMSDLENISGPIVSKRIFRGRSEL